MPYLIEQQWGVVFWYRGTKKEKKQNNWQFAKSKKEQSLIQRLCFFLILQGMKS